MMKIVKTDGCVAFDLTCDGVSVSDMSKEQLSTFTNKLLKIIKQGIEDNTIQLTSLIETIQYDEYISDNEPCDQCGDHVTKTIWELPDIT